MGSDDSLPADLATAHALILAQRQALSVAEARAAAAEGEAQYRALLIEKLKYTIKKLQHERYGQSAEHGTLLEQLELELADLEEDAAQAETAAGETITVPAFERRKPARRPLPDHLPRERILYPAAAVCPCCGGKNLRKIGEDITETAITQPPAPSHPIARGRAGPKLLAHILFSKYGLHRVSRTHQQRWRCGAM